MFIASTIDDSTYQGLSSHVVVAKFLRRDVINGKFFSRADVSRSSNTEIRTIVEESSHLRRTGGIVSETYFLEFEYAFFMLD